MLYSNLNFDLFVSMCVECVCVCVCVCVFRESCYFKSCTTINFGKLRTCVIFHKYHSDISRVCLHILKHIRVISMGKKCVFPPKILCKWEF
jgi:hypothetical protein